MRICEIFEVEPGEWVEPEFAPPTHSADLRRIGEPESKGFSTASVGRFTLDVAELSPGAAGTWARTDGWPAFGTRIEEIAKLLGGKMVLESFKKGNGPERHVCRFIGPSVEV